jgi:hypothetical protein
VTSTSEEAATATKIKDSGWGNPFKIGLGQSQEQVIAKYREWVVKQPQLIARLKELNGKRLAYWCKPHSCHGDVLVALVDELEP